MEDKMQRHPVASREQWLAARKALLLKEKEFTHLRDKINVERLALPWVKVEKSYVFDTPNGNKNLSELFDGRSQLIVYHFMLGPGWDAGCPGCSFLSDHIDGALPHLEHHDVTWTAVSRAPLGEIEAYKKRMGWRFPWVSAFETDFNYDSTFPSLKPNWRRAKSLTTSPKRLCLRDRRARNCRALARSTETTQASSFTPIPVMLVVGRS
jgi:predicted dithiol-disulfide oxidoreductase (DUF899 family)